MAEEIEPAAEDSAEVEAHTLLDAQGLTELTEDDAEVEAHSCVSAFSISQV